MKRNWRPLLVVALVAAAVYYLYPSIQLYRLSREERIALEQTDPARLAALQGRSFALGLDLQGGIHLVMEVNLEGLPEAEARDAVDRAQEVIRNRIDQFGVSEPIIQRQGENRIIVELPGIQDIERAKALVGRTALLEFRLVEPEDDHIRLFQRIDTVLGRRSVEDSVAVEEQEERGLFDEELESPKPRPRRSFAEMLNRLGAGGDFVCQARDLPAIRAMLQDPVTRELIPSDQEVLFSSKPEGPPGSQFYRIFLVRRKAEMTGSVVQDAFVSVSQDVQYLGQSIVNFLTTDDGARLFSRVTGAHVGERLAIVLDGAVYSAPEIRDRIREGRSIITGSRTPEEAKDLAIVLRAGALPAEVIIIEDRTIGPSLGRDSIEKGKTAAIYSLAIIALFMIAYYRKSGLIADLALLLNILFILAILAGFNAALTLPGIAGIILTMGMAVDANVLIFERIREELRAGRTSRAAVESGYDNALSAIIDANVTTLLVGIVLYQFGTGPVRGFALTLCIGIISSLFTAFFVTRAIFELLLRRSEGRSLSIGSAEFLSRGHFDFLSRRHLGFATSGVIFLLGMLSIVALNGLKTGIDFAGGTLLEFHFEPPVSIGDIRSQLSQVTVGEQIRDFSSSSEIKQFGGPQYILIRVGESGEDTDLSDGITAALKAGFPGNIQESDWVRRVEKVGPKIGSELSGAAVRAVLVSLVLILLYMAWRFHRVLYGIAAVVALFHDVLITIGLLSLFGVEISLAVVAALLAIIGYSLNDTIVVFDRIRENLHLSRRQSFAAVVNISINECLSRTLITSLTTLIAVAILMIWGGEVNRDFTITLAIGIIVGTYSSIFIASPVLYLGQRRLERTTSQGEK